MEQHFQRDWKAFSNYCDTYYTKPPSTLSRLQIVSRYILIHLPQPELECDCLSLFTVVMKSSY